MVNLLLNHPNFELTAVIGSGAAVGASYRTVWEEKEAALQQHYGDFWRQFPVPEGIEGMRITSFDELLHSDCEIVFSSIPERAGAFEDELIKHGHVVFSNS